MWIQDQWEGSTGSKSHLFTDNVIQVRNTDISFDQRNLINLLREGPLLDVIPDPHIIVGRWAALRNKHLLWKERRRQVGNRVVISAKERGSSKFYESNTLACHVKTFLRWYPFTWCSGLQCDLTFWLARAPLGWWKSCMVQACLPAVPLIKTVTDGLGSVRTGQPVVSLI